MNLKMFDQVALKRDVPAEGLRAGDVATLVDIVPGAANTGQGGVLEVFNALGQSVLVTAVALDDIEPLTADEILAVRRYARAG